LNKHLLDPEVQAFIDANINADVHRLALSKSPFQDVSAQELAAQIMAKKRCEKKLPTWFNTRNIYYPPLISVEQCSSEATAAYKASLVKGDQVTDLTGGFGVDAFYFSKLAKQVTHCEINEELSEMASHNAKALGATNLSFVAGDGLDYLKTLPSTNGTLYIDPARRSKTGKVFLLKDCTPNVVEHMELLRAKSDRIIIKAAPLLDLSAGIKELKHVSEVQVISTKNECKELLFICDREHSGPITITSVAINSSIKTINFPEFDEQTADLVSARLEEYLYEPDVALLKTGKFNAIGNLFSLKKLDVQSHLYTSNLFKPEFPGRIFRITDSITIGELKKQKSLFGNAIVRNYPEKAENLVKKYKIAAADQQFLIFSKIHNVGYVLIKAEILQYY
jgi:16S rRNA G966 N2-methylase RsmD